jgi:predicted Zn-dependent peptidase
MLNEIGRLERGEFSDKEMERAKTLVTTDFVMSNEKASSIAGTLGLYETMVDLEAALEYSDRIRRVTRKEICEAVRRYLPANGYTFGILKPKVV